MVKCSTIKTGKPTFTIPQLNELKTLMTKKIQKLKDQQFMSLNIVTINKQQASFKIMLFRFQQRNYFKNTKRCHGQKTNLF